MRILFSSYAFAPSTGGIETVSALLADEFIAAGHEVELITETPGPNEQRNYRVTRRPSLSQLLRLLRWSDVFFQNNISLRSLLPALLLRKPIVVVHQTWLRGTRGQVDLTARLKRSLLCRLTNVSISSAIAGDMPCASVVIPNPYRDDLFREIPEVRRDRQFVFVGRLVSDKGVDLLLRALAQLRDGGLVPDLTVIGDGPERESLARLTGELGLVDQVRFVGAKSGIDLVRLLNQHRVMVVPSRWAEPFGIVALEGIACGCGVIGSAGGGLPEAIGPCGITFPNGDVNALASALRRLLTEPGLLASLRENAQAHLAHFRVRAIVAQYLELLPQIAP